MVSLIQFGKLQSHTNYSPMENPTTFPFDSLAQWSRLPFDTFPLDLAQWSHLQITVLWNPIITTFPFDKVWHNGLIYKFQSYGIQS